MLEIYLIAEDKKDSASCSCIVNLCHPSVIRRWFFKREMSFGFNMLCFKTIPQNISNSKSCHHYSDTTRICRRYFQLCNLYELKFANEITETTDVPNEMLKLQTYRMKLLKLQTYRMKLLKLQTYRMKLLKVQTYRMKLLKLQAYRMKLLKLQTY